ncbi:hypothetical protein HYC85_007187 [Camellia sinensis]|uniref:Glutaredoxin domain-containing protein n=2 Tax=Camellia TaxID=4441 RepID=A0A7J7HQ66_CAMSI|nr:hypothetical protein HYC85_007187 [Camellia sinensis]KAI8014411.1 Uncharacterized protein LOK49_LG05G01466 [Camellia lanceoleosa]
MWLRRAKSTVRVRSKPPSNFSCKSFKDIQYLCTEDFTKNPQQQQTQSQSSTNSSSKSSIFHRVRLANSTLRTWSTCHSEPNLTPPPSKEPPSSISIPGAEKRIVVYFTSLRVVRSTFEDCRAVRSILYGFRVSIDERDLCMDSKFMEELQAIFGNHKTKISLPRVFIGGRYVGGAEEIRELHEAGELKKFIEGLPAATPGVCEVCGSYRFILCVECSGSHKCYSEKDGFATCVACNENGLIRCPSCLSDYY